MQWLGQAICPNCIHSNMNCFINKLFVAAYLPLTSLTHRVNINCIQKVTSFITLTSSLTLFLIIQNTAVVVLFNFLELQQVTCVIILIQLK